MNKIKLHQLEMLVAVADTGGFGKAAAELGCTQSSISHAVTELERTLAVRLLNRSRSGCTPTEAGNRVLGQARQMLRLAQGIVDGAADDGAPIGHVRIACFRSVGSHLLPPALAALAREFPGIRIDLDDSCEEREDVGLAVAEGRADLGIAQLPVGDQFTVHNWVADAYVMVAPASLALKAPLTWEQFDGLSYLQLNCTGALAILAQCRAAGFKAEVSRTLTTDTGILALVKHGIGYAIMPRLAVFPVPDGVQVLALPIPAPRQFALVALPALARTKAVQIVTRFLRNQRIARQSDAFRAGLVDWS